MGLTAVSDCAPERLTLSIGGLRIGLRSVGSRIADVLDESLWRFVCQEAPDVELDIVYGRAPLFELGSPRFDRSGGWQVFRLADHTVYVFRGPLNEGTWRVFNIVSIHNDGKSGTVYALTPVAGSTVFRPFSYPMSEVICVSLLSGGHGVEVHAVGVCENGIGELFCGVSGAGKSTMAQIWHDSSAAEILNDDRIIIGQQDRTISTYGTPWHGDAHFSAPISAPIQRVFFLHQGSTNRVRELSPQEAVRRLVQCTFMPYWDPEGMDFCLGFLKELATSLDCYELTFVRGPSVVDFVRRL